MFSSNYLIVRDFEPSDLDAVHRYASDAEVARYMDWGPNSLVEAQAFLTRAEAQARENPRTQYELAVIELQSRQLVGGAGLHGSGAQTEV